MDSEIIYNAEGNAVGFSGPLGVKVFQATVLVSGLGLLSHGLKPNRSWTQKKALARAGEITGQVYKRGQLAQAQSDLREWIAAVKPTIPTRTI